MTKHEEFATLAQKVAPIDAQAAEIKMRMIVLAREIGVEILREAFPDAVVARLKVIGQVVPSDRGQKAAAAAKAMTDAGLKPTTIIVDENGGQIIIAI